MTPPRVQLSPIGRRFRRYKMQCGASAAMAEALKRAPRLFGHARQRRIDILARRIIQVPPLRNAHIFSVKADRSMAAFKNEAPKKIVLIFEDGPTQATVVAVQARRLDQAV